MIDTELTKRHGLVEGHEWFDDPKEPLLRHRMLLSPMREYVMKHKNIFRKAIILYAKIIRQPTRENCVQHNTHILMEKEEKFFRHHHNHHNDAMLRAAWKIMENENEHDPYYAFILSWLLKELQESDWHYQDEFPLPKYWRENNANP